MAVGILEELLLDAAIDHQLAGNTRDLLKHLGIDRAAIVGQSMGGMLAARFALQYPQATERLVLVNPIGLEDWRAEGVPWRSVDAWHARERKTSFDSIRDYQRTVYYGGDWKPAYERWVRMLGGMYAGEGGQAVAWSQALTSDMVFNQPVVHELPRITAATTLLIGQKDRTAIGKDLAPPEVAQRLGDYPALGRRKAGGIRRPGPLAAGGGAGTLQRSPAVRAGVAVPAISALMRSPARRPATPQR